LRRYTKAKKAEDLRLAAAAENKRLDAALVSHAIFHTLDRRFLS
jgi:hypothetical protein